MVPRLKRPYIRAFFCLFKGGKRMAYQIPRGCQDVFGNESYKWQALEQTLRSFCYMYNYDEIRTPIFEHTEVFKEKMIQVTW